MKEYFEKWRNIKLSDASRARIQEQLLSYARFQGVREAGDGRSIRRVPQRTSLISTILNLKPKSMTAGIIAVVLIAGGSTSYASESAVPGDFLYVVKTEVNENVKSLFAISDEAEARLQARLAEERLKEAETLAARGELTADVATGISTRVKAHFDEAEERNNRAYAEDDHESSALVRATLEGNFRAYADIIAGLNTTVQGNDGAALVTDLRGFADSSADTQARATATVQTTADLAAVAEGTLARAENLIADVTMRLTRAESEVDAGAYARARAKLDTAATAHAEATVAFRNEAYTRAYTLAQAAIRIATEVEAMLSSMLRLRVNISTDTVLEGVLDITASTSSDAEGEANGNAGVRIESESRTETESGTKSDTNTDIEIDVDTTTDTTVDTPLIDAGVETDATLRPGISL